MSSSLVRSGHQQEHHRDDADIETTRGALSIRDSVKHATHQSGNRSIGTGRLQRPFQWALGFTHLLVSVLEMVGGRTLLLDVPLVCKEWMTTCRDKGVSANLNFKDSGLGNVNDFVLFVMLQRFPSAMAVDISGQMTCAHLYRADHSLAHAHHSTSLTHPLFYFIQGVPVCSTCRQP